MFDASHITKNFWMLLIVLQCSNTALTITLVIQKAKLDISLIILSSLEFSSMSTNIIAKYLARTRTSQYDIHVRKWICYMQTVLYIFTTTLWIYWINTIIMNNQRQDSLYIKQLEIAFTTFYTLSLILKSLTWITSNLSEQKSISCIPSDIESQTDSTEKGSFISSSAVNHLQELNTRKEQKTVKMKDSVQTLVPNEDDIYNLSIKQDRNRELNIKLAECINVGDTYYVEHTSEISNCTPNMMQYNVSMPNLPINNEQLLRSNFYNENSFVPSTPISHSQNNIDTTISPIKNYAPIHVKPQYKFPRTKSKMFENKNTNFIFNSSFSINQSNDDEADSKEEEDDDEDDDYDEYHQIRMLNISEIPQSSSRQSSPKATPYSSQNATLATNFNRVKIKPLLDDGCTNHCQQNIANSILNSTKSTNVLWEELNKEIKENDLHKLQHEESLEFLRFNSIKRGRGSFSKTLRNSISASALNLNLNHNKAKSNIKPLNNFHMKSSSLSTLSTHKSKLQSPLKKLLNLKDAIEIQVESGSIPEQELDLNLVNSIRASPKKKTSTWSLNSKAKHSLTRSTSVRNEYLFGKHDLDKSSHVDNSTETSNDDSQLSKKQYLRGLVSQLPGINKNMRNVSSNTTKSSTSTNSIPSGYYGQYDKEKWQAIKKVSFSEGHLNLNLGNISQLSTSTIPYSTSTDSPIDTVAVQSRV